MIIYINVYIYIYVVINNITSGFPARRLRLHNSGLLLCLCQWTPAIAAGAHCQHQVQHLQL